MIRLRSLRAGAALLACFTGALACENDANDCTVLATCGAPQENGGGSGAQSSAGAPSVEQGGQAGSGEAGSDGASGASNEGGAGGDASACDRSLSPAEDACVLDEALGVFVSPEGDDDAGDGSRGAPLKTLAAGVAAASERGLRVYACAGDYEAALELDEAASGIELFGGLSCEDFSYTGEKALVAPPGVHTALVVTRVEELRIEDFAFVAAGAGVDELGVSSIGAFVASSSGVQLRRVRLEAGRGGKGPTPQRDDARYPTTSALAGSDANGADAGDEKVCECPGSGSTTGGAGGDADTLGQAGQDGLPDHGGGEGGNAEVCDLEPARGADAPEPDSAAGATVLGELSEDGWSPRAGASGGPGQPGQGGGGGGAITISTNPSVVAGGGGGGCGGCGGVGGPGGGGGGSIALASFESQITIESSELVATDGGNGGSGRMGQAAQIGRGEGGASSAGCPGGEGGNGASGAPGGGGAGGVSVGALFRGARPTIDLLTAVAVGNQGLKGPGGLGGDNDGIAGVATAVLEVP